MLVPHINGLGLQIMEALWSRGPASIRDVHDQLPEESRPGVNTTRATFYRLAHNGYVRPLKQVGHSVLFEAAVARDEVYDAAISAFAELLGDNMSAVISRLVETGRLSDGDVDDLRQALRVQANPRAAV